MREFGGWDVEGGVWEACFRRRSTAARMLAARVSALWRWYSREWGEECIGKGKGERVNLAK